MKKVTGSLIGIVKVCRREAWLHANGIRMEHTSETVAEGKLIHETSYPYRAASFEEIEIEGSKIDFYDPGNKVIHEIKKSDKMEHGHIAQIKYYLYLFRKNGIEATGLLEYPRLRKTLPVVLEEPEIPEVEALIADTDKVINQENCPPRLAKKTFCRSCSYFEFCWTEEQ